MMKNKRKHSPRSHYHIKRYIPQLKVLKSARTKKRKEILGLADPGLINAVAESANNCLKGHVPLNRHQFGCLKKHRQALRQLASKKTPLIKRKRIIQKGGFLGALLTPVIQVLSKLFG